MRILTFILHLLSKLRLLLYRYKILKTHSVDVPIISVGNIEHGGTGKTPMIAWLIKELQLKNKKICVVTRGYGRNNSETIVINLKDTGSPVLIKDLSDINSFHVVMPMKI